MVMQPWFGGDPIQPEVIERSLKVLNLSRENRKTISAILEDYEILCGQLAWKEEDLPKLSEIVRAILEITDKEIEKLNTPEDLKELVRSKLRRINEEKLQDVCFVISSVEEVNTNDA